MSLFKTITEGGQIWTHRVRMARQVFKFSILTSLAAGLLCFGYKLTQIPSTYYYALGYYAKASLLSPIQDKISVNGQRWYQVTHQSPAQGDILLKPDIIKNGCRRPIAHLKTQIGTGFVSAASLSLYIFGGIMLFFLLRGWRSRKKQTIEGQTLIPAWKLSLHLKIRKKVSSIKLANLPLIKGTETQHLLISGATGTGKTNAFYQLLPQIRALGQKAIIVDTSGDFVAKFYREGKDILLNPFDARGVAWHPWAECRDKFDYKSLAQGFIPSSYRDDENFWRKGAQEVFYCALQEKAQEMKTSALAKLLLHDSLSTLSTILKGTTATPYLDMSSEKTAGSVRAVASGFLECLEMLNDTENPFSIRDWILNDKSSNWLFLSSTVHQRASLIPLLSAWVSVSIHSLLQASPDPERRLWFVMDELPRLHKLNHLEAFLTESRKYGGCGLLAIQSPSQLETIYGKGITRTLIGNCATRIAFAEYDPEIAHLISRTFGEKETRESHESISYGAHETRDSVSLSFQAKTSAIVSPTALQSLNPLEAFVKVPGNFPITKVKFKYQNLAESSKPFSPVDPAS